MKNMTPKQRAKIYREAAEYFATADWHNGLTGFCMYVIIRDLDNHPFPEIQMFDYRSDSKTYFLDVKFFDKNNSCSSSLVPNHNQRVMCLLLAEQIALNPIYK